MRTFLLSIGITSLGIVACGGTTEGSNDGGGGSDGTTTMPPGDASTGMDSTTGDDSSTGTDSGGGGSTPGKVACGMMSCTSGTEVCCIRGGGFMMDAGLMYSCQPPMMQCQGARIGCDEAADCMGGVCCGGLSMMGFGARCSMMGMGCGMGSVQLCKTNQECGDAGTCTTWTCPYIGQITSCTKPFGQCM